MTQVERSEAVKLAREIRRDVSNLGVFSDDITARALVGAKLERLERLLSPLEKEAGGEGEEKIAGEGEATCSAPRCGRLASAVYVGRSYKGYLHDVRYPRCDKHAMSGNFSAHEMADALCALLTSSQAVRAVAAPARTPEPHWNCPCIDCHRDLGTI